MRVILFFVCPIIENFEKVFIHCFIISCIIIYHIRILLSTRDKMVYYIKFKIVKS